MKKLVLFITVAFLAVNIYSQSDSSAGSSDTVNNSPETWDAYDESVKNQSSQNSNGSAATDNNSANNEKTEKTKDNESGRTSTVGIGDIFKFLAIFGVILAAIYFFMKILKRVSSPSITEDDEIAVISSKNLANNRHVHIVSVGKEFYLIGSTDSSVNKIAKIENEQTINSLQLKKDEYSSFDAGSGSFSQKLMSALGRKKDNSSGASITGSLDFLKKQKDKLNKMK